MARIGAATISELSQIAGEQEAAVEMGLVECPPSSWLVRLAARKQARTRRLGSRFVRSRRRRGWSHQFARGRVQGRASLHRDRSRSLGQRPSSERPGWSSGRRPSGQWNLRSASEIGCSLMLASRRSIRPSASNCVQTSTDHRAHDPIYDSGTHRWPCDPVTNSARLRH